MKTTALLIFVCTVALLACAVMAQEVEVEVVPNATQPTAPIVRVAADTMPQWAVMTLAGLGAVVLILGFVNAQLWPQVKQLVKNVADAIAEARAAKQTADDAQTKAAVAETKADNADARAGRIAARTDTLMLASTPPGTGTGSTPQPPTTPGDQR